MIHRCRDLLSDKDMSRFKQCIDNGSPLIAEGDKDLYELWKGSFVGTLRFHHIMYGINGLFEHEEGGEDNLSAMGHEDKEYVTDNSGYLYFVAYHQLHAFFAWPRCRNDRARMYCEFEVCCPQFCFVYVITIILF